MIKPGFMPTLYTLLICITNRLALSVLLVTNLGRQGYLKIFLALFSGVETIEQLQMKALSYKEHLYESILNLD